MGRLSFTASHQSHGGQRPTPSLFSDFNIDPQLPLIIEKVNRGESLNDEEHARFYYHADASMRQLENAFSHYQAGTLSEMDWQAQRESIVVTFRTGPAREVWSRLKPTYNAEFVALVDELLSIYR